MPSSRCTASRGKRPELHVQVLDHLPPNYRALMVGTGPELGRLEQGARDLPGRVVFRPCTHQVGDMLAAMDVFLLGSPSEGFCLTILEAMYAGLPVVASPVGALAHELATSPPVYWPMPVGADPELAARVVRDAAEHAPAETRVRTALAREIVAREFTAERMGAEWDKYLRRVLAAESERGPGARRASPSALRRCGSRGQPSTGTCGSDQECRFPSIFGVSE
jgi:glycosyltransferase involved in cell wall biosynthesis